jgi:prevent-host-death family protein
VIGRHATATPGQSPTVYIFVPLLHLPLPERERGRPSVLCTPVDTGYHRCMKTVPVEEMSVRELRADLADVINAAGMHDQITFVTSRGRRVAAVVSVAVAEGAAEDSQASDDAAAATMYAVNVQLHEDRGGTPSLTVAEIFEDYATDLLREFGHDPDRIRAAARVVAAEAADKVGYPMLWRQAALAVELCQRAVEITGRVLPGSYRPGSRASKGRR